MMLDPFVFYNMTPRNFFNALKGYRRKEDNLSKERWVIARKMMYATIMVHAKNIKETDVMTFPWERKKVRLLQEEEIESMREQEAKIEKFFAAWDAKKNIA